MGRKKLSNAVIEYFMEEEDTNSKDFYEWAEESGFTRSEANQALVELAARFSHLYRGGKSKGVPPANLDPEQLKKGIEVEYEHTADWDVAKKIAIDHLTEFPDYYTYLDEMEKRLKEKHGNKHTTASTKLNVLNNNSELWLIGGAAVFVFILILMSRR